MSDRDVRSVQTWYPQIYFACHVRHEHARTSPHQISQRDASLLAHLDEERPTSPASLARHLGIRPSTLSAAVAHLESLGYVRRARDPADRRRIELRLTRHGATLVSAGSVLDAERVRRVLARLGPAQRERALEGLELLAEASVALMDEHGGRPR